MAMECSSSERQILLEDASEKVASYPVLLKLYPLAQDLIMLSNDPAYHKTNCRFWAECISLLMPLFEELREFSKPLNSEELSDLITLESLCSKLKELIEKSLGKRSKLLPILQKQRILKEFMKLSADLQSCIRSLPLRTLQLSDQTQMQVEQCSNHLEAASFHVDALEEGLYEQIGSVLLEVKKGIKLSHGILVHVAGKLDLKSNQEILREGSLLEKEMNNAHMSKEKGEVELIHLLIVLVSQMADDLAEQKQLQERDHGISIPADFRCPLSLELMLDPVIVASGQTYERAYIQEWLDQGNTTCPKSRQFLSHTNLIPNYSVKALIVSWSESNNVTLPDHREPRPVPYELCPLSNSNVNNQRNGEASCGSLKLQSEDPVELDQCAWNTQVSGHQDVQTGEAGSFLPLGNHTSVVGKDPNVHPIQNGSSSSSASKLTDNFAMLGLPNDSTSIASSSVESHADEYRSTTAFINHSSATYRMKKNNNFLDVMGNRPLEPSLTGDEDDHLQAQVRALVENLQSPLMDVQATAVKEIRILAKHSMQNRIIIANCQAIPVLVSLLHSTDHEIQENAVTALLNLSLNDNNKSEIVAANAIQPLVHVLRVGATDARENAAAALYSLSVIDENRITIGQSGAITPLVDLLVNGTPRGKKDAATALYNLSIRPENKLKIVEANAVNPLIKLISDPSTGMVDKGVAVIQNLAAIPEGRMSIFQENGIPALVEVVEIGSQRGKENAAAALFQMCSNNRRFRSLVLQEGAVPPLIALARSGTARAKEKATSILRLLTDQRQGT